MRLPQEAAVSFSSLVLHARTAWIYSMDRGGCKGSSELRAEVSVIAYRRAFSQSVVKTEMSYLFGTFANPAPTTVRLNEAMTDY